MTRTPEALTLHPIVEHRGGVIGSRVPLAEHARVLNGTATYVADIRLPGMVDAAFVRSPVAHGVITALDESAALTLEGVIDSRAAAGLDGVSHFPDYIEMNRPVHQFPLCAERVRYVGAPVAVVVAQNRYLAEDGAELVAVSLEIDQFPAVTTLEGALASDAILLYPEWGDNRVLDMPGDRPEVRARLEAAPHRFQETYYVQRQTPLPMETRGVVASYGDGRLTVWTSHQSPHIARTTIALMLGLPENSVKVVCPQVGGGFGAKTHVYAEDIVIGWLAMHLGRPVRWIEDRSEHLVSTVHAREQHHVTEVGYDDDGNILAMRCHVISDVGSGEVFMPGTCPALVAGSCMTAAYDIPHLEISTTCIVTNKTPSGAYRGFGVPEAVFVMERVIERVASLTGRDANELRARMILRAEQMPYTMPGGGRIDSGSHEQTFARATELGTEALERAKKKYASADHIEVGVGYTNYVEPAVPTYVATTGHWAGHDSAAVRIDPDGRAVVSVGVADIGQGIHATTRMIAADALGMAPGDVAVVMGDTDRAPYGLGAWGSRSAVVMTGSVVKAADRVINKARVIAAHLLEADVDDIVLADGVFGVRGSPGGATVSWGDIGTTAWVRSHELPPDTDPGLEASATYQPFGLEHLPDETGRINAAATWPNASHAAIVAVDVRTGHITIEDYVIAHDCGVVIHPTVVEGQIHGGVVQGIAGAMYETLPYDRNGQPQFASFMEYLVPTVSEVPSMRIEHFETPAPEMPLGIKGVGEAGAIGPPAALANAVGNALRDYGVDITATPITPPAIRAAIRADRLH